MSIITLGLGTTYVITQGYHSGPPTKIGILETLLTQMEKAKNFSLWEPGAWEPGLMNENAPMRDQLRRLEH